MFSRHPVGEGLAPPAMSRKCQWFAVGAGLLTRPPSVGRDTRRARRLGAPPYRVSPCGASFFPSDGKETKGSPGETHIAVGNKFPSASSSFSPGPPEFTGAQFRGGCRSLSGAGKTTTAPATAPLPLSLSLQNQDGLDSWTKRARLIAQGLISAEGESAGGSGTRPYGAISVTRDTMAAAATEPLLWRRTL